LVHATQVLDGVDGVSFTWFNKKDVVRHPLVQRVVNAYEEHDAIMENNAQEQH
jgi:phosphate starvation-inducible PhoH-like protein